VDTREFSRVTRVRAAFCLNSPAASGCSLSEAPRHLNSTGTTVNSTVSISDDRVSIPRRTKVTLSPWVNEPLPPFQELLSAHDVARLTRRPKLVISGLMLLRRFPKRRRFRGRQVGWLRSDVLDWMARDLAIEDATCVPRRCAKANPRQPCLPFECSSACRRPAEYSTQRITDCRSRRRRRRDA
jgi:predicted DNA-binding transcriptional regulator AlpA